MSLDNIRIVMLHTSHPGNIGAAARVMKNMGLLNLYLVQPEQYPHAQATAMASGADDVLHKAVVCESLEQALHGVKWVVGTTARERKIQKSIEPAREAAINVVKEAKQHPVALLFGRERIGLTNEEIGLCHRLASIPSNPDFSSLNVASAIQIFSYEVFMACSQQQTDAELLGGLDKKVTEYASAEDVERFYQHLEQTLININFLNPLQSPQLMPKLRNLYNRIRLEQGEINILRGILTETQKLTKQ